jgi:hypothetical protein
LYVLDRRFGVVKPADNAGPRHAQRNTKERTDGEANVMAGKYKGRHAAGNVPRTSAESDQENAEQLPEGEVEEHHTASDVQRETEELQDESQR